MACAAAKVEGCPVAELESERKSWLVKTDEVIVLFDFICPKFFRQRPVFWQDLAPFSTLEGLPGFHRACLSTLRYKINPQKEAIDGGKNRGHFLKVKLIFC